MHNTTYKPGGPHTHSRDEEIDRRGGEIEKRAEKVVKVSNFAYF